MKEISTRALFEIYQSQYFCRIIDCRDIIEYEKYHIKDSINVPFNILCEKPYLFLNKEYEYFIICQKGNNSKSASLLLSKLNYKVINVVGGIEAWPGVFVRTKRFGIN